MKMQWKTLLNKKIITACILNMKHSRYGNIMPIPIDKDGKRLATDEFGEAIDQSKLIYVYSDKDDNEVGSKVLLKDQMKCQIMKQL